MSDTVHKLTTNCCSTVHRVIKSTQLHNFVTHILKGYRIYREEGPGMGVDGVISYDNRVLGGVPGVVFRRVLMISSIHAQWFSIHHSV